jgi:hypothetical protein
LGELPTLVKLRNTFAEVKTSKGFDRNLNNLKDLEPIMNIILIMTILIISSLRLFANKKLEE